jgi:serine protease AprX
MRSPLALILFVVAALSADQALAQGKAVGRKATYDQALSKPGKSTDRLSVIVKYKAGTSSRLKKGISGRVERVKRDHQGARALAVELLRSRLDDVCARPEVEGCSLDAIIDVGALLLLVNDTTSTETATDTSTTTTTTDAAIATEATTDTTTATAPLDTTVAATATNSLRRTDLTAASGHDAQKLRATLALPSSLKGGGVGIAIIDSDIASNPDIANSVAAFFDFTRGGVASAPLDPYGHGTHIAGLIAGNGMQSNGKYVGVAPSVRLIGLRVLDENGQGYTSDVIAALEFATTNKARLGIDIINLSLGHPIYEHPSTDPLVQAVERAAATGIVVVASAGNWGSNSETGEMGYGGITSPGNAPSVLTVGSQRTKATASRLDDEISLFSSRGPTWYDGRVKPEVVAPGQALVAVNHVNSTLYRNEAVRADVAPYIKLSGTSMAAGVASGVAALMIEANRVDEGTATAPLTPNIVKAILQYSAIQVPFVPTGIPTELEQGSGGINCGGAIALARAIDPNVTVDTPWLDAAVDPFTTIAGIAHTWSQSLVWGSRVISGDTLATWNLNIYGLSVVWGDSDVDSVVWGDVNRVAQE